jgi:protein-tyrosine-phosphatase
LRIPQLKKILFVCSGNTCRSPLAEGIAKKIFPDRTEASVDISSAGSSAFEGTTASEHAIEVARRHGVDVSGHQSRLLSRTDVREADLVVTMSQKHRDTVGILDPEALAYTVLLTDFCDDQGDVPDPIGGDIDEYERAYGLINRCVMAMAARLDDYDGWKRTGDTGAI